VKHATRWMAFGLGVGCATVMARAMIGHGAGLVAAILSDFEARRTEGTPSTVGTHRTVRTTSTKLPTRLKADIELVRSQTAKNTIDLTEPTAPLAR
jgi:hypothetical protein